MNKYRLKVSEAGLGYYHAFKLWPEARPLSKNQQQVLNLFEFLIEHGKEVKFASHLVTMHGESVILVNIFTAYQKTHPLNIPFPKVIEAIGITSEFFRFLIQANMLLVEEVNDG